MSRSPTGKTHNERVFEALEGRQATVTQLVELTGLPRPKVLQCILTLREAGRVGRCGSIPRAATQSLRARKQDWLFKQGAEITEKLSAAPGARCDAPRVSTRARTKSGSGQIAGPCLTRGVLKGWGGWGLR